MEGQQEGTEGRGSVAEAGHQEEEWDQVDPGLVGRAAWELEEARRDVEVLKWIGRFRFVTAQAIAEEFEVSWQRANARARRLERVGLVDFERQHASQARAVFVTGRGATLLGWERHRAPRPDVHREHEEAIVWLVSQLERRDGDRRVLTERECRRVEREGRGRYSVEVAASSRNERRRWPDAVIESGAGRAAIEVEFAPKSSERLQRIIVGYVIAGGYRQVTFLVKSAAVGRRLQTIAARWAPTQPPGSTARGAVSVAPWPGLARGELRRLQDQLGQPASR